MTTRAPRIWTWMTAVFALGIALAALIRPMEWWTTAVFPATYLVLILATIGSVQGPRRNVHRGFAACGWGLLLIDVRPWSGPSDRYSITRDGIERLHRKLYTPIILTCPDDDTVSVGPGKLSYSVSGFSRWYVWNGSNSNPWKFEPPHFLAFRRIAEHLVCLASGAIGGLIFVAVGKMLARRPRPDGGGRT